METAYPDSDCSFESFEGIRSQDILPLLIDRFHFAFFYAFAKAIDPFIDRGFGPNFDPEGEWDRAFIDRVHACDESGISSGRLKPTHMLAVLTASETGNPVCREKLTPEFCVRYPWPRNKPSLGGRKCKISARAGDYPNRGRIDLRVDRDRQDALYAEASAANAAAMRRLARGYEADPDRQRDLLQEMHLELWLSLRSFDGRCGLRTWVYRIANNVGASHIARARRLDSQLVDLETLEARMPSVDGEAQADQRFSAAILLELIHRLKPLDRQVILLYLEGEAAGPIAEVTGLSAGNVATKIHRIKRVLKQKYLEGANHAGT